MDPVVFSTATLQYIQFYAEASGLPIDVTKALKAVVDNTSEQVSIVKLKILQFGGALKLELASEALKSLVREYEL